MRGLKLSIYLTQLLQPRSHPTRVRGLKYLPDTAFDTRYSVAPHAGAWIEIPPTPHPYRCAASHPTRVRGLKSCPPLRHFRAVGVAPHAGAWIEIWMHRKAAPGGGCRTPRGCVDCGLKSCPPLRHFRAVGVAPHAGAWIEIWMHRKAAPGGGCRTPRGCVD